VETTNEFHHKKYFKLVESERNFEKLIKYTLYLGNKIAKYNQLEIGECTYLININGYYTNKDQ
jgi:gamma-tubulin complex component 6